MKNKRSSLNRYLRYTVLINTISKEENLFLDLAQSLHKSKMFGVRYTEYQISFLKRAESLRKRKCTLQNGLDNLIKRHTNE